MPVPAPSASYELSNISNGSLLNNQGGGITAGVQGMPSALALDSGRFAAAWVSNSSGSGESIQFGIFNAATRALVPGAITDLAGGTASLYGLSMALLSDGNIALAWAEYADGTTTYWTAVVNGTTGAAVAAPRVLASASIEAGPVSIAARADGYVIAYSGDATPANSPAFVAGFTNDGAADPTFTTFEAIQRDRGVSELSVAVLTNGTIVVVAEGDEGPPGVVIGEVGPSRPVEGSLVGFRYWNPDGTPVLRDGDPVFGDVIGAYVDSRIVTAALPNGSVAIAFDSGNTSNDLNKLVVMVRGPQGEYIGGGDTFVLGAEDQLWPSIAVLGDSGFAVSWSRRLVSDGSPTGTILTTFLPDGTRAPGDTIRSSAALDAGALVGFTDGRMVLVAQGGNDGGGTGIIASPTRLTELFVGTNGDDVINGSNLANQINGLAGADVINGLGGDDLISGDDISTVGAADVINAGDGDDTATGLVGDDTISGGAGHDSLDGGADHDRLLGQEGNDSVTGAAGDDVIFGGTGNDRLDGGADDDLLNGDDDNDTLLGGNGNDTLIGGLGADRMEGGAGNDIYRVDHLSDVVLDIADGGYDRVLSTVSHTLGVHMERLGLLGTADLNGVGNVLDNQLDGNSGANSLSGGSGRDRLFGYAGIDTLIGGSGNDTMDGGLGADSMVGGADDDTYLVDDAGDAVVELENGGYDRVIASVSYALDTDLERLSLSGTADINGTGNMRANQLEGNAGANILDDGDFPFDLFGSISDSLHGGAGDDTLIGNSGADRLDGGLGADSMAGGIGDDSYVVDDALDVVFEEADGGIDRVVASVSHTLTSNVERLTFGGASDLVGTGNTQANRMIGNVGANTLDGGDGNDTLYGLGGNDTLIGRDGADILDGGLGTDSMTGGLGADRFVFGSAIEADDDVISDFSVAQLDRIDLRRIDADETLAGDQGFTWIGGAAFSDVAGQLRFAGGVLEGDVDGNGGADFQIGLTGVTLLSPGDIWL
jgi:Ca2+-binding RTX toxin-like protein